MIDLRLHPQTALLMLIDALMSSPGTHKLELYVEEQSVGGVLWALDDGAQSGKFLFADSDLAKLLASYMEYLKQLPSEAAVQAEPDAEIGITGIVDESAAVADATGVPE